MIHQTKESEFRLDLEIVLTTAHECEVRNRAGICGYHLHPHDRIGPQA